ncbi:MAG: hypothetical protein ACI9OJ_005825 [Myxococcota bacterium]|jgi:hypothetical protein
MKPEKTSRTRVAGRLFSEFLVIVLGVLIALAVDAGWDRRQDREIERASIQSLVNDLDRADSLLTAAAQRDSVIIRRADSLLAFSVVPGDAFVSLISGIFDTTPVDVRLRTYDELLNTGRLQLLRDRDLRLTLTEFDAAARTLSDYSTQVDIQWSETARPVLYRSVDWDGIAALQGRVWGEPGPDLELPGPEQTVRLEAELRAAIRDRRALAAVRSSWFIAAASDVLERLRALVAD